MADSILDGSVAFLRPSTIECLSVQLNPQKLLRTENKSLRDWRGVYEGTNIQNSMIYEKIKHSQNPFKLLLEEWKRFEDTTIVNLLKILETMERFDVIDDNCEMIKCDMQAADKLLKEKGLSVGAVENKIAGSEKVLTYDDIAMLKTAREVARYDVLILHADEDIIFAERMAKVLEQQNIKVCLKDRDLLVGTMELEAVTSLISERCNKVAVPLTPEFFNSPSNNLYSSLAQSSAIAENRRSFLPIIRKPTDLPTNIKMLTKLNALNDGSKNPYFWRKLCLNIKENFEESSQIPLPKELEDGSQQALNQIENGNITTMPQPMKASVSSSPLAPAHFSSVPDRQAKQPSGNTNESESIDATGGSKSASTSTSSNKLSKLKDGFLKGMVNGFNGLVKKGRSGMSSSLSHNSISGQHAPFVNDEPEFHGVGEMSASAQICAVEAAPSPPTHQLQSNVVSSRKKKGKTKNGYAVFS
eukprot:TRINITY_DN839_c0_g1_i8.p1 TRINITY_DN839_c0_g1~~TRINITY_DN839_c0_g1_i8.p1  ORF type:complete len:472 (-),score=106.94 TRINITY_DN839_c0_g1_i8:46-1461(-)